MSDLSHPDGAHSSLDPALLDIPKAGASRLLDRARRREDRARQVIFALIALSLIFCHTYYFVQDDKPHLFDQSEHFIYAQAILDSRGKMSFQDQLLYAFSLSCGSKSLLLIWLCALLMPFFDSAPLIHFLSFLPFVAIIFFYGSRLVRTVFHDEKHCFLIPLLYLCFPASIVFFRQFNVWFPLFAIPLPSIYYLHQCGMFQNTRGSIGLAVSYALIGYIFWPAHLILVIPTLLMVIPAIMRFLGRWSTKERVRFLFNGALFLLVFSSIELANRQGLAHAVASYNLQRSDPLPPWPLLLQYAWGFETQWSSSALSIFLFAVLFAVLVLFFRSRYSLYVKSMVFFWWISGYLCHALLATLGISVSNQHFAFGSPLLVLIIFFGLRDAFSSLTIGPRVQAPLTALWVSMGTLLPPLFTNLFLIIRPAKVVDSWSCNLSVLQYRVPDAAWIRSLLSSGAKVFDLSKINENNYSGLIYIITSRSIADLSLRPAVTSELPKDIRSFDYLIFEEQALLSKMKHATRKIAGSILEQDFSVFRKVTMNDTFFVFMKRNRIRQVPPWARQTELPDRFSRPDTSGVEANFRQGSAPDTDCRRSPIP